MLKKQQNYRGGASYKAYYKLFLCLVMLNLIVISMISAIEWDNVKHYNSETKTVTIENAFGLGSTLAEIKLLKNTYSCGEKCYAEGITDLRISGRLIDGLRFKSLDGNIKEIKNYKIFIKDGVNEITIDDFVIECDNPKEQKNNYTCRSVIKEKKIEKNNWVEYNGDYLDAGVYEWRIEGEKEPTEAVDWLATWQGKEITEWAEWRPDGTIWCYQEYANVSTTCSGLSTNDTGTYTLSGDAWGNPGNMYDGNPGTFGNVIADNNNNVLIINYTKPKYANNNSLIQFRSADMGALANYSIPKACWDNAETNIVFRANGISTTTPSQTYVDFSCFSGAWTSIYTGPGAYGSFYEEGMVWNLDGIQINTPLNNQIFLNNSLITFNATLRMDNLKNSTLYINGTTYETLEITGSNNYSIFNITFSEGAYNFTFYSCDNTHVCLYSETRNFNISRLLVNNQTFTTPVVSSSTQDFKINIDYDDTTFTNIIGNLIYDGTSTTATKTGSGVQTIFTASKTIPLVNGIVNKTFYWNFTLTDTIGSKFNSISSSNNQTVTGITLNICNATYNVPYVNFTFEDELLGTAVSGTFSATFDYWLTGSSGTDTANYSFQNLTVNPSYAFCVSPNDTSIDVNMNAQYGGTTFIDRTYYLNGATLTNTTNNIILYQLNDTDAVKFFITVKEGIDPFAEATVTISKFFVGEGVYKTIGIRETDASGEFIEYLELDQEYRFAVTRGGENYGVIDKTSACAEAPCEIELELQGTPIDYWEGFDDYFAENVQYSLWYNDTNKLVSLAFIDTTGLAQYMRLEVNEINTMNSTKYHVCNTTLYSSSGTITCNMTEEAGDFIAKAYISRSPEKFVDSITFIINAIKDILGADGLLISLFLIITIALVGAWSPTAGIVLTSFAVLMMKMLGFVAFGWTTVSLIILLAVIIIVKVKQ